MDSNHQNPIPSRVPAPGVTIKSELEARDWSQRKLAEVVGRPIQYVSELVNGKRQITPEAAIQLEAAFGVSAQFWLNLEANYRLWKQRKEGTVDVAAIQRRAAA